MASVYPRFTDTWRSARAVTRVVPINVDLVLPLAEQSGVRILRRPNLPPRFHQADLHLMAEGLVTVGPVPAAKGELAAV